MKNNSYNNSSLSRESDNFSNTSISDLVKKEQEYRHKWQDKFLRNYNTTFRIGQVFGLIYNVALLFLVFSLVKSGEKSLALKIFAGNIAIIAFALLVTTIERKVNLRKPTRKGGGNRKFNNSKKGNNRNSNHNNQRHN